MNIFELAAQQKLRFNTGRGDLTVEQLYDLPLQAKSNISLDGIAISLDTEIRETAKKSFVSEVSPNASLLDLKLEIVKHIIKCRIDANKKKVEAQELISKRKQLEEIISVKKQENLTSMSLDELEAELKNLK